MVECSIRYQLEYYNTYKKSWSAIRTTLRTFSTQFDLMKDIRVRVYTLLSGPCTNNTVVQSTNYTELIQNPPRTGVKDTEVQDFLCVFYNMEYMECKWRRSPKTPAGSQHNLYFWHKELEQAVECPKYLISAGVRSGCSFRGKSLPDFTDINFCINGSAPEGPLRPTFISLQIQNHVKCATTEKLDLQIGQDMQLELNWEHPDGRIPGHCLEWEVEHTKENPNGKTALIHPKQTSLTFPAFNDDERNCFRVRSKLHKYCADRSFWSDWSPPTCYPVKAAPPESQ
ncbi:interleukin-13 receptor subunit alpha-2 isoform 2-T2 [Pholidichthys leucotaenia]